MHRRFFTIVTSLCLPSALPLVASTARAHSKSLVLAWNTKRPVFFTYARRALNFLGTLVPISSLARYLVLCSYLLSGSEPFGILKYARDQ